MYPYNKNNSINYKIQPLSDKQKQTKIMKTILEMLLPHFPVWKCFSSQVKSTHKHQQKLKNWLQSRNELSVFIAL